MQGSIPVWRDLHLLQLRSTHTLDLRGPPYPPIGQLSICVVGSILPYRTSDGREGRLAYRWRLAREMVGMGFLAQMIISGYGRGAEVYFSSRLYFRGGLLPPE